VDFAANLSSMKKRIFAAIDISDEARRRVFRFVELLRGQFPNVRVGWVKPEKIHLTLKFLGEIDESQLEKFSEAIEKTSQNISKFKIQIGKTGVFPSAQNARILWLGLKDETGNLRKLNEILESECERKGVKKEIRSFKAHLTIGRLKEKSSALVEKHLSEEFEPIEFKSSEIVIYQSELLPQGSIYKIISKYKFQ
jgi:2'-5' RNA ligase